VFEPCPRTVTLGSVTQGEGELPLKTLLELEEAQLLQQVVMWELARRMLTAMDHGLLHACGISTCFAEVWWERAEFRASRTKSAKPSQLC